MTLGQKIIELRKENKLSQEKLSEILQITRQTLSNWENDITYPDINNATKIASYFNISLDELVGNNLTFIEDKLSKNEKLAKKNIKYQKIILITIYFIVLIFLLFVMIYYLNKKDYTTKYQIDITCAKKEIEYTDYIRVMLDEQNYACTIKEQETCNDDGVCNNSCDEANKIYYYSYNVYGTNIYNDGKESNNGSEKFIAGYSFKEAIDSLNTLKKVLIEQGYVCK